MARSKGSSDSASKGFLFSSDSDQIEDDQVTPEKPESRPSKTKKKRSAKTAKKAAALEPDSDSPPAKAPLLFGKASKTTDQTPKKKPKVASATPKTSETEAPHDQDKKPVAKKKTEAVPDKSDALLDVDAPSGSANKSDSSSKKTRDVQNDAPQPVEIPVQESSTNEVDDKSDSSGTADAPVADPVSSESAPNQKVEKSARSAAYQVVARRYRPQTFDELIGQEVIARALSNAIETNRVGHAYLFTGARGVGKTSCARIFAKALNCIEGPTIHPCLKCESCTSVATGEDVDVIEIDGASNRGVDEIRQLRQNASVAPSRSHFKIYIIDEVHMLTREAFNALLKTLEEPPRRVKFIFCTTEPNKIPITILSRCQRFDFSSISAVSIVSRLEQIAKQEGAQVENGVFDVLARRANGSMRDAQSLLEQALAFAPNNIALADVHNMLGSVDDQQIFDILEAIVDHNTKKVFDALAFAAKQGVDFGTLVEQTLGVYRDLMVVSCGCKSAALAYSPIARFDELKKIAAAFGIRRILASLQILDQTLQRMRFSAQSQILAEIAFARLCMLDSFQALESLINQLKDGTIPTVPINSVSSEALSASPEDDKKKTERELTSESQEPTSRRGSNESAPHAPQISPFREEARLNPAADARMTVSQKGALLTKSKQELAQIWTEATKSGVMLQNHASAFCELRAEPPRTLTVVFPKNRRMQRDYCENERGVIESRLASILGEAVSLRLITDPNVTAQDFEDVHDGKSKRQPVQKRESRAPVANFQELSRQVADSSVAQQIKEIFDARLSEVKPPVRRNSREGGSDE